MKKIGLTVLLTCSLTSLFSQKSFERIKTQVHETYEASYNNFWTGEKQSLKVSLIEQIDSFSKTSFVLFEVFNKDYEQVAQASSLAFNSLLNFSLGTSDVSVVNRKQKQIVLSKDDFIKLTDFLSETLNIEIYEKPAIETSWQLSIEDRFLIALIYRPNRVDSWAYCLSIDGAAFEIPSKEARVMLQKLGLIKSKIAKM